MVGRYVVVKYGGLQFRYTDDFEWSLSLDESILPAERSVIRGLCGNCNEDPDDDLVLLGGGAASSVAALVNSFALTQVSGPVSQNTR